MSHSKFHKSRYLPLSDGTAQEINTYLDVRRHHQLPNTPETPLIWNRCKNGNAYSGGGIGQGLRALFRQVGIYTPEGNLPRPHDIRHSFAVNALLRWYRSGANIHAKLFRLAIVLLYTTGLRRGELIRLKIGDYAPQQQTLLVSHSKFHKSRYLPLSDGTAQEINTYLDVRRHHQLPNTPETPLIWNRCKNGNAYSGGGIGQGLRALFRQVGIYTPEGNLPRPHDIRHSFAVNALLRWYRSGANIHAKLPLLSTYMGHVSIVSTEHYLHFIEELASHASERFDTHYGAVVVPLSKLQESGQ